MQQPTLLILAAGMGSRYGGLKQIDPLGPNGETIIDYSIYDAIKAGFGKIVFVIRKSIEEDFLQLVLNKYKQFIEVDYVLQEVDSLPQGFQCPSERTKPWGTGHAILMAKGKIDTFFAVINGDDFYGSHAFQIMSDYLTSLSLTKNSRSYSMIAYSLSRTLSENGTVSRGVCTENDEHFLVQIKEFTKIQKIDNRIVNSNLDGTYEILEADTPVSMNFWGFHPSLFQYLEELFIAFLKENSDNLQAEFYIPFAIDALIKTDKIDVKVLKTKSDWFGVTYYEDRKKVIDTFQRFLKEGIYPLSLY
ncbi:MAG: sugar phosphate nucleotidyltransferase [Bacteroidales bacterium]|jgi:UTP-glucose-1-phosphate uridylyltransferase|nr:nucleotidyltransferase [Bacteroidales bacterium]